MYLQKKEKQYRAFLSFDAMFSIVPLLLMLVYLFNAAAFLSSKNAEALTRQQTFDKIVSVADYIVKNRAVRSTGSAIYPNWIEANKLAAIDSTALAKEVGLTSLRITLDSPGEGGYCIYRIVVVGDSKEIRKLFVCGG